MATNLCPDCGRPMGPGMSFCAPCAAARRRQRSAKQSKEFNPTPIVLVVLLAIVAGIGFYVYTVTIPKMKMGKQIERVRTHDIIYYYDKNERHATIEQIITRYNPQTGIFKPDLVEGFKPAGKTPVWKMQPSGVITCDCDGATYAFKIEGDEVASADKNGEAILNQEGNMISSGMSMPSSVPGGL
ncbi:MAG: hypothetical protein ACYC6A_14335 [Armatimonadota bacterium]